MPKLKIESLSDLTEKSNYYFEFHGNSKRQANKLCELAEFRSLKYELA